MWSMYGMLTLTASASRLSYNRRFWHDSTAAGAKVDQGTMRSNTIVQGMRGSLDVW